jgi:lipoprotein-releasing system ATP-binding protein
MESNKVIETIGLMKYFYDPVKFQVIKGIDLSIDHGDFVSIEGRSG